jgi:hypothetical protein
MIWMIFVYGSLVLVDFSDHGMNAIQTLEHIATTLRIVVFGEVFWAI